MTSEHAPAEPPQRELRYEGFPLEAVLARVHAAHGADVTITGADRVRRGGFGGFFAREVFQVTVTVPVPTDAEPNFVQLGRMSIFGDDDVRTFSDDIAVLGEERDLDERDYDQIDPEDVDGALGLTAPVARSEADAEIWALLAAAASAPAPASVVPTPTPAPTPAPAPVTPAPVAKPTAVPSPVVPEVVAPILSSGPIASTTLIPASSIAGTPFDPALAVLSAALVAAEPTVVGVPSPPSVRPVVTTFPTSAEASTAIPALTLGRNIAAPVEPCAQAQPVDLSDLIARFDAVPPAYELPPAGIIAVVGTRSEALQAAGKLATSLGIPNDDVIVASPPSDIVLPTDEDTMRLAATTRFRCRPIAVIVVELVPGRQGHEWVRMVLDGLRAEQVRLAVDTSRLLAHQHLSIPAVGGVDVIDLLDATQHPDPAAALDLPTPIATIDGRPATPELWAATVLASGAITHPTVNRSATGAR